MHALFGSAKSLLRSTALLALVAIAAFGFVAGPNLVGAQDASGYVAGDALVVNTDALNLRADATVDAEIIATLETGAAVTIVAGPYDADDYVWYQVDTDAGSGYVAGEFLGATVTISTDLGFAIGDSLVVNTDALNLRSAASTSGDILAELVTGDAVSIVDGPIGADGYTWYQISSDYGTGWVAGDYLGSVVTVASTSDFAIGDAVYVATDVLNLRSDATTDGEILAQLETGVTGTVIDGAVSADGYVWYQIETDLGVGWVAGEFLALS